MNCIVCLKKLEKNEGELCSTCFEYFSYAYRDEPEKRDEVLRLLKENVE